MKTIMSVYDFGRRLVETQDLDPVYVCLWHSGLSGEKLKHWLLAYWCFYHVGTASWIVDQPNYWAAMEQAAGSKEWPRSAERRHFRGAAALKGVEWLKQRGVEELWNGLCNGRQATAQDVMTRVKRWYLFGDWISFKVGDMLERLGLYQVVFFREDIFSMFEAPRKGAELMAEVHGPATDNPYDWAYDMIVGTLDDLTAPPVHERPLNVQEVETILCKWKSHMSGHYEIGKDTHELLHGLVRYARCPTSQLLVVAGAKGGLW